MSSEKEWIIHFLWAENSWSPFYWPFSGGARASRMIVVLWALSLGDGKNFCTLFVGVRGERSTERSRAASSEAFRARQLRKELLLRKVNEWFYRSKLLWSWLGSTGGTTSGRAVFLTCVERVTLSLLSNFEAKRRIALPWKVYICFNHLWRVWIVKTANEF